MPPGERSGRPQGALRAIDRSARPRLLADLRSAPPAAAIWSWRGGHPGWYGM